MDQATAIAIARCEREARHQAPQGDPQIRWRSEGKPLPILASLEPPLESGASGRAFVYGFREIAKAVAATLIPKRRQLDEVRSTSTQLSPSRKYRPFTGGSANGSCRPKARLRVRSPSRAQSTIERPFAKRRLGL